MPQRGLQLVARARFGVLITLFACAAPTKPASPNVEQAQAVDENAALLARLPGDAQRCVFARPTLVDPTLKALLQPLSQAGAQAWLSPLEVAAYARAERDGAAGTREQLEYVRFASADAAAIRSALAASDTRQLHWADEPSPCTPDATCTPVEARFVDAHTVQLRSFAHTRGAHGASQSCTALHAELADAIEIASWSAEPLAGSRIESQSALHITRDTLTRTLRHRFHDERSAQLASERAFSGEEDAPMLGSSLAQRQLVRRGVWLEQRTQVTLEELALATRERAQEASLVAQQEPPPKRSEQVDHEALQQLEQATRSLCKRAQSQGRVQLAQPVQLPIAELPRLLSYWARLPAEREQSELGLHIVAHVPDSVLAATAPAMRSVACGKEAFVITVASNDDAQLQEQGARLALSVGESDVQLFVAIRTLGEANERNVVTIRLLGSVSQGVFTLREVGRPLRAVRWPLIVRYLRAPLSTLQGSIFPPDEWTLEGRSPHEALNVLAAAQSEPAATCDHEQNWVRCKGSFADPRAGARALRRGAAAVLLREARQLWSSAE